MLIIIIINNEYKQNNSNGGDGVDRSGRGGGGDGRGDDDGSGFDGGGGAGGDGDGGDTNSSSKFQQSSRVGLLAGTCASYERGPRFNSQQKFCRSGCTEHRDKIHNSQLKQQWRYLAAKTTANGYGTHCTRFVRLKNRGCAWVFHGLLGRGFSLSSDSIRCSMYILLF